MFCVIQLFVFVIVFGRIVHRTIHIRPNSLKPLFGTSLKSTSTKIGESVFSLSALDTYKPDSIILPQGKRETVKI